jgi:hypothetical protein
MTRSLVECCLFTIFGNIEHYESLDGALSDIHLQGKGIWKGITYIVVYLCINAIWE